MKQVVIVGAGPTGATLALLLVKWGIKVKLIEASRDFQRLFRGEGLMPSGLDALEQMGLLELIADISHQSIDAWDFLLSGKSLFRVNEPIEKNGQPCTTVSQPHLLSAIIEQAQDYPQFEFIQGEAVKDLVQGLKRVNGVKLASGQEIMADLIIAADGRNSVIRNKAGIELTKLHSSIDILWFKLDSGALSKSENTFYSIIKGRDAFGLFRASSGKFHIGWGLHADDDYDWKETDWAQKLAETAPPWLAKHIETHGASLTKPMHLSVVVGRCDRWFCPGLLLLGDAVHPMSPIRAQGINMAFRDAIVAANHLIPLLIQPEINCDRIDKVLPLIQQEREREIICIQQLQGQEMAQAELLHKSAFLRWGARTFAPIIRPGIRASWLRRQRQLRQGVTKVRLSI
ncbi:FAD-dependent monooxygenase [Waterburya agarophytonicola K14]|uniref:FAD-dependent monooxygenase n=1 Tax=Waterburya agarophytonicola KI4 TaxID=2874699 RepID=A0A964FHI9_9CYAN|nr:FAD-dependent monooxygenase [Waterburya agarophytonicola]MCC0177538.1 FAD-dependent monooxygenase [Waterburya agarophytonicola KI4]